VLNSAELTYDSGGRVSCSPEAPTGYSGGRPFNGGLLGIDPWQAVNHFSSGLGFVAAGNIATTEEAPTYFQSGMGMKADRLCVDFSGAITHRQAGLPRTAEGALAAALMSFWAGLTTSLVPNYSGGSSTPTFTRATIATVIDFEALLKNVVSGEARFTGARRVRNLIAAASQDITNAAYTGNSANVTRDSAIQATATANNGFVGNSQPSSPAGDYVGSVTITRVSGAGAISVSVDSGATYVELPAITTVPTRYSVFKSGIAANNANLIVRFAASGDVINAEYWQTEEVTSQSNQNPSEYVSVGVLASPFHGAGVDGSKSFNTLNGNTVASNVVTAATGAAISGATLKGYLGEGARTQYLGVTDAPANQTTTILSTGTYTCWLDGGTSVTIAAGSATITGGGAATPATPLTFVVTGAGTVTATVVGVPTRFQIENGSTRSSYIPNAGAAGTSVVRNKDLLTYVAAGNMAAATGAVYCEPTVSNNGAQANAIGTWAYDPGDGLSGIFIEVNNGSNIGRMFSGGQGVANGAAMGTTASASTQKIAGRWALNDLAIAVNGVVEGTDATANVPTSLTNAILTVGGGVAGTELFGNVKNVRIYPTNLSNAQLAALTA